MAGAWNLPCVPHVACSSLGIVGLAANLHLIGSTSNSLFLSYDAYQSSIRKELVDEPIEAVDGYVTIPNKPGLGIEMNEKMVQKYCLLN
jgi:L-alanine-DL-glutamate epimerase-like enolase superfamily enzyme